LDSGFNPGAGGDIYSHVDSLAVQADGEILVGGSFTTLGGQPRNRIGRLNNTEPATQSFSYDGSTITWLRGGTSPEVWRTTFEYSTDALTWVPLGAGTRVPGGWQVTGVSLPPGGAIRARGHVTGGQYNGSSWFVETILTNSPQSSLQIIVDDGEFGVSSNQFGFNFSGSPGQVVVVEGSTNLSNWLPLRTNTLGADPLYFADPDSAILPWRFYRLRGQ
jgi:hypothetical protein